MRYTDIHEARIGDFETHGMDQPGTFPAVDRRLLI